jgi:hypothetical protein
LTNNQITQNLFGVNLMGSNTAVEVSGNTFSSNTNLGMLLASGTGSVGFNHNIVEDHSALGVQLTTTDGAIVAEANVIRDNHGFSAASFETDTGSMTMTNNLVFGNSILGTGSVTLNTQSGLVTVTNNTVFDNFSSSTGSGVLISLNDSGSEAQVFNNIFFENSNFGTAPGDDLFVNDDTDTVVDGNAGAPVTVSHNILFDFDTTCQLDSTACTPDVTDSANNAEDPLFVDGPNGNFNLLPGSPAIGAGDPAAPALPAQDFADNPINNPPDLGALQAIAAILVDPSSINFGDVSTEVPNTETITIQNTGGLDLNVSDISLDDAANFALDFSGGGDPCGSASFTLVGGDACTLDVIFDPQGGGAFNATITIASNDSTNPAVTVTLSGTGVSTGGCAIAKQAVPNFAWLGIFLILIPWLVRFRNLKA